MSRTSLSPQCSINDGAEFKAVADAMKVIGFKQEEIQTVYRIVAAILHLVSPRDGQTLLQEGSSTLGLPAAPIFSLQKQLEDLLAGKVSPVYSSQW